MRAGLLDIELVGERFQVHIRRIHLGVEILARLGVHVACRHRHRFDATVVAGIGYIHRILGEDHRVVVGEGHALAPQFDSGCAR